MATYAIINIRFMVNVHKHSSKTQENGAFCVRSFIQNTQEKGYRLRPGLCLQ